MKCPRCGGNIPAGARNCGTCGALITYRRQTPAQPAARPAQTSGRTPSTNAQFAPQKPGNKNGRSKGSFRWWQIPIYILVFLIGIGVGSSYTRYSIKSSIASALNDSLSSAGKTSKADKTSSKTADEPSKDDGEPSQETSKAEETPANAQPVSADSGTLGDYDVAILDARKSTDYEGKPVLIIGYRFTNNSDDNKSFAVAIHPQAYQNSVQLENAILAGSDDTYNSQNYLKDVQPGGTLEVEQAYLLQDETNEVTVEVAELISFSDDKLTKKFSLTE